uniref:Uncharacterized protein n=1 Tax=Rhizophora mucronata TaxID=61149 RepID=A0A2P2NUC3_RHIMU
MKMRLSIPQFKRRPNPLPVKFF